MDIAAVMDAIATTIRGSVMDRVYEWPSDSITVPCAVVGYPEELDFDVTFARGADRAVFPVWLMVGRVSERHSRNALSELIKDATGIKGVLDGDLGGEVQTARLTDLRVEEVTVGGVTYVGARGLLEVYA